MKGWSGQLLWVDLSRQEWKTVKYPAEWALMYVGGRGLAARLLWEYMPAGADPLGPENLLIMAVGPLSGLPGPSTGKLQVAAKSPLTGGYGDGNIGTYMSIEMRKAGIDAIVFSGVSRQPVTVVVEGNRVSFEPADDLWGLDTWTTEERLRKRYGRFAGIVEIGPAGENLVKFATIISQEGRSGGRPGIGAVMGSKKLKAVVVRGSSKADLYDERSYNLQAAKALVEIKGRPGYPFWMRQGTMATIDWAQETSVLPAYNFNEGVFDEFKGIDGFTMESMKTEQRGCPNCNMQCGNVVLDSTGVKSELDYENVALLGSNLGIGRLADVALLNRLADQFGMDTESLGTTLSWAVEASQEGFLKGYGVSLEWGDVKAFAELTKEIANRSTPLGDLLAEASSGACRRVGGCELSMDVKGLGVSAYDCHAAPGMALSFATSPIGAHHKDAWVISWEVQHDRFSYGREKAAKVIELQRIRGMFESFTTCRLPWVEVGLSLDHYPLLLYYATGVKYTWDDLYAVADRTYALIRALWVREKGGWSRDYDMPPVKWFKKPLTKGPLAGAKLDYDKYNQLLDYYYELRGWDRNGVPTRDTLHRLGLDFVIPTLEKYVKLS
ncbi:MAG: aldehyde ferredoxin oxidoreductase family protein [Acidilobus sp.]|nr:aldehyde ferredoxin oxidoreductase family protein [Acidilobus sp.]MCG2890574.1 aldehyde ferredoxin oxidoreductase family protein [Acidilobus sp.]